MEILQIAPNSDSSVVSRDNLSPLTTFDAANSKPKRFRSRSSPTEPSPAIFPVPDPRRRRTSTSTSYPLSASTLPLPKKRDEDSDDTVQNPTVDLGTFKLYDMYPRRQRMIMFTLQKKEAELKTTGKMKELSKEALKGKRRSDYSLSKRTVDTMNRVSAFLSKKKTKRSFADSSHLLRVYMHDRETIKALQILEDMSYTDSRKKRTPEFSQHFLSAISYGLDQVALALFEKGILKNCNAPIFATRNGSGDGDFPFPSYFLLAIGLGSDAVVKAMMKRAYLNQAWLGLSPIHLAVAKERLSLVNLLLEGGADVMAPLPFEMFQLLRALKSNIFECLPKDISMVNAKPAFGKQWRSKEPMEVTLEWARSRDLFPIDVAAATMNCDILLQIIRWMDSRDFERSQFCFLVQQDPIVTITLLKAGARPNQRTPTGCNPMHIAARAGAADLVAIYSEFLDVNERGENGWTPLHEAVSRKHEQVVRLLVHFGALREIRNDAGESTDDMALKRGYRDPYLSTLFDKSLIPPHELHRIEALRASVKSYRDPVSESALPPTSREGTRERGRSFDGKPQGYLGRLRRSWSGDQRTNSQSSFSGVGTDVLQHLSKKYTIGTL